MIASATSTPNGIELDLNDSIATIAFKLAQPKNAFRSNDAQLLGELIGQAQQQGARCLVLRGSAGVFSAG